MRETEKGGRQSNQKGPSRAGRILRCAVVVLLLALLPALPGLAKDDKFTAPKEPGAYVMTAQGLKRLLPNIVFDEKGVIYIESNNPQRFLLKDVELFVLFGKHDMQYLTLNALSFLRESPLGRGRFVFGKEIKLDVTPKGKDIFMLKPKDLLARGYYALWVNEAVWDFVIE